jgi:hypothetical protein
MNVRSAILGVSLLLASAHAAFAQPASAMPKKPTPEPVSQGKLTPEPVIQGFGVVLLLGDTQASSSPDNVPISARKALSDMRDFLPYKSYQVLDVQWTRCCGSPTTSRLRGADDQDYELQVRSNPAADGRLFVQFLLREPGTGDTLDKGLSDSHPRSLEAKAEVQKELFMLERELSDLSVQKEKAAAMVPIGGMSPEEAKRISAQHTLVARRIAELRKAVNTSAPVKREGRTVIDTSFGMDVGETVVVGTSRLKGGNRALIAILTAARQASAKER